MPVDISMFDRALTMWNEIDFRPLVSDDIDLARHLDNLAVEYANGTVLHKAFEMPAHPDLDDFVAQGRLHDVHFFDRFWRTPSVSLALPFTLNALNFFDVGLFKEILPIVLPGSLASALVQGGEYSGRFPGASALRKASKAAEVLLDGKDDDCKVFTSNTAWSSFFLGGHWDLTWIVIQPVQRRIHVILATDPDGAKTELLPIVQ